MELLETDEQQQQHSSIQNIDTQNGSKRKKLITIILLAIILGISSLNLLKALTEKLDKSQVGTIMSKIFNKTS